ncbi:hypothetical protein FI667_g17261, partial [Globisporangium splendens]
MKTNPLRRRHSCAVPAATACAHQRPRELHSLDRPSPRSECHAKTRGVAASASGSCELNLVIAVTSTIGKRSQQVCSGSTPFAPARRGKLCASHLHDRPSFDSQPTPTVKMDLSYLNDIVSTKPKASSNPDSQ